MIDKLTKIALSGDDFDAFSKALDNPSEPNEALKSLFAGHIADLLERCGERIGGGEPNTFTDEIYDAVDRLRAFSAALDRDASQVRDSSQQSSDMDPEDWGSVYAPEIAWLIEWRGDQPLWWGRGRQESDANEAVRFCREQDAQAMIYFLGLRIPIGARAVEHKWIGGSR